MKDSTVQSVCGKLANGVPDKTTGNFYRPDYTGFYEGSGRFLSEPAENAAWSLGYASEKLTPAVAMGDVYVSGSDGKKRTLESVPKPQFIRAVAVSDGSGRGAHVFASLDCAGLSNAEVKEIRLSLRETADKYDLRSINLFATGDPGGADTVGLWGDLPKAALKNLIAVRSEKKAANAVSGVNSDCMEYLRYAAAKCIRTAVESMQTGSLCAGKTATGSILRFTPDEGERCVFLSVQDAVLRIFETAPRADVAGFTPVKPLLNVLLTPLLIPADNAALLLAAKLKFINNPLIKVSADDDVPGEYHYVTEAGIVQLGDGIFAAMIPTEGKSFGAGAVTQLLPGLTVIGLANDTLGLKHARHTLNGVWAKLPADAGKRTQNEINGALSRTAQKLTQERHAQNV